jgi:tetratricopeptide (TPR) repeat protein
MKSESIAFGVAGVVFGLIAGWVIGAQQATSRAPQAAPQTTQASSSTTSAPVLDLAKVKVLEDAAGREPSNAEPRVGLANLYFDAERYDEAVRWYQEALKLTPNDVNVSTDLGVSYYYMNQADKALEQFEHSLTIDPKHTKTLLNIGIVKAFGKQDLEGASTAWGQVLQIAPDSPEGQAAKRALDSLASAHPGMTETSRNSGP